MAANITSVLATNLSKYELTTSQTALEQHSLTSITGVSLKEAEIPWLAHLHAPGHDELI